MFCWILIAPRWVKWPVPQTRSTCKYCGSRDVRISFIYVLIKSVFCIKLKRFLYYCSFKRSYSCKFQLDSDRFCMIVNRSFTFNIPFRKEVLAYYMPSNKPDIAEQTIGWWFYYKFCIIFSDVVPRSLGL